MTPEEFDQWIYRSENIEKDYELIGGVPVEIGAIRHDLACLAADMLDGGNLFPDFKVAVKDMFTD